MRRFVCLLVLMLASPAVAEPWQRHTIDRSSRGADGVRVADVNGDTLMDITTGWEEGGVIRVYLNPGPAAAAETWPAVTVGEVATPEDAVFVDLDGDTAVDVVSSCEGKTRTMFVHWAPRDAERYLDAAAWKTEAFPATRDKQRWMFALPMQIDGVGGVDLVVGSKNDNASIGWLRSPADPRDLAGWKYHRLYDAGWIMSLEPLDVDGDGDLDVVASDRRAARRGVLWLENPGAAAAANGAGWNEHRIGADGVEVLFLTLCDLDGDGLRDVLTSARESRLVYLRRLPGEGARWQAHDIALPYELPFGKSLAVDDIDLDGRPDIVMTNRGDPKKSCVSWMSYDASVFEEHWTPHDISGPDGQKFDLIQLLDLDDDGDLDVVTCEEIQNLGVFWYENPTR